MKRGALLLPLFIAAFGAAACSGGGSTTLPPPPPNGFSKASLNGQYAFIMTGQAVDGFGLMRIGTFVADGNGTIQGGTELVNTISNGFEQLNFSPGTTYGVSSDGRGAINLLNASGQSAYSITFTSPTQGYICETDGVNGASGTFELQDSSALSSNAVTGPFVFDVTGAVSDTNNNLFAEDDPERWTQRYLPDNVSARRFYQPGGQGFEASDIAARLERIRSLGKLS